MTDEIRKQAEMKGGLMQCSQGLKKKVKWLRYKMFQII